MKNKYYKRSRIYDKKFRQIIKYFCKDFSATDTADLTNINVRSINNIYIKLRKKILTWSLKENNNKEDGIFELDESYFGAKRIRGKRGRGAVGKVPVFGILKRNGKVYISIVKNCSRQELLPIIKGKILEGSTINTDGWKSYDGLILNGYKHYRVYHSKDEFARGKCHVNGIESFWGYAKKRMLKFNGVKKEYLLLHLKETEFRFNHRNNFYEYLLRRLRRDLLAS